MVINNKSESAEVNGILISKGANTVDAEAWKKLKATPYVQKWIKGGFWEVSEETKDTETVKETVADTKEATDEKSKGKK